MIFLNKPFLCPECVKVGLTSTVTVGGGSSTLAIAKTYYDEQGQFHCHDTNYTTDSYTCSNGHDWKTRSYRACSMCGWTADPAAKAANEHGQRS